MMPSDMAVILVTPGRHLEVLRRLKCGDVEAISMDTGAYASYVSGCQDDNPL